MYCGKCGAPNPDTGKFCTTCGAAIGSGRDTGSQQPAEVVPISTPNPAVQQVQPAVQTQPVIQQSQTMENSDFTPKKLGLIRLLLVASILLAILAFSCVSMVARVAGGLLNSILMIVSGCGAVVACKGFASVKKCRTEEEYNNAVNSSKKILSIAAGVYICGVFLMSIFVNISSM